MNDTRAAYTAPRERLESRRGAAFLSLPLVRYVLLAAVRDRLLPSLLAVMAVAACLAIMTGSTAIVEGGQAASVFMAGGLRMIGVAGIVLFVVFHIRRSFENKDVDYLLSRPIGRTSFVLSHAVAFCALAAVTGLAVSALGLVFVPERTAPARLLWAGSIIAELVIMANAALFFSMVLRSATTGVLATLGLYVLARMMGELLGVVDRGPENLLMEILGVVMQGVSLIVPRLDLFGQTSWLVYGTADIGPGFVLMQAAIYSGLLLSAAAVDLTRRQF